MITKDKRFFVQNIFPGVPSQEIIFVGMQESGFKEFPSFSLYNLTQDITGHVKNSTVSRSSLIEYGYVLPSEAP